MGRKSKLPVLYKRTKEGSLNWTNDMVGEIVNIPRDTYESCLKHQDMTLEFRQGLYWDSCNNATMGEVNQHISFLGHNSQYSEL